MPHCSRRRAIAALLALAGGAARAGATPYDPLALPDAALPPALDLTVHDLARGRDLPLRVMLPPGDSPAPVLLFSHGLGGSRAGNSYLGRHWSARGYAVVYLQHPGSDEAVWQDAPPARRLAAMQAAANLRQTLLRLQDVPAVIDQLERWQRERGHPLAGRLDLSRLGLSGHSFGALTTQGVSGQRTPQGKAPFTDARIRAALVMSPSAPRRSADLGVVFGQVAIPWLLMTGTRDVAIVGDADLASRLAVFRALPAGGKYELVLDGAEHDAFGDDPLRPGQAPRNPNHHRVILGLSTAFWDAWLRGDAAARAWLDGPGPRTLLDSADRWQTR